MCAVRIGVAVAVGIMASCVPSIAVAQENSISPKEGRWTVMGVVVDGAGKPADGKEMGWLPMFLYEEKKLLSISLAPPHTTKVRVVDWNGELATDARVAPIQGAASSLAETLVDQDGMATLQLPKDMPIYFVYAIADEGFNYIENIKSWPTKGADPLPDEITIQLVEGTTIQVFLQGSDGKPISGVAVGPWTMTLPDRITRINGLIQGSAITDKDGIARLDSQGLRRTNHLHANQS